MYNKDAQETKDKRKFCRVYKWQSEYFYDRGLDYYMIKIKTIL